MIGTIAQFKDRQVRAISFIHGQQFETWLPEGRYVVVRQERIKVSDRGSIREHEAIALRKDVPMGDYAVGDHRLHYVHPTALARYYFVSGITTPYGPINVAVCTLPGQTIADAIENEGRLRGLVLCHDGKAQPISADEYDVLSA